MKKSPRMYALNTTLEYRTEDGLYSMSYPPDLLGYIKTRLILSEIASYDEAAIKIDNILKEIPKKMASWYIP